MAIPPAVEHGSPPPHNDNSTRIDAPLDPRFNDLIQRRELRSGGDRLSGVSREKGEDTERKES